MAYTTPQYAGNKQACRRVETLETKNIFRHEILAECNEKLDRLQANLAAAVARHGDRTGRGSVPLKNQSTVASATSSTASPSSAEESGCDSTRSASGAATEGTIGARTLPKEMGHAQDGDGDEDGVFDAADREGDRADQVDLLKLPEPRDSLDRSSGPSDIGTVLPDGVALGDTAGANESGDQGEIDGNTDKGIDSYIDSDGDDDSNGDSLCDSHRDRESSIDIDRDIDHKNETGHKIEGDGGEIGSGEGAAELDLVSPNDVSSVSIGHAQGGGGDEDGVFDAADRDGDRVDQVGLLKLPEPRDSLDSSSGPSNLEAVLADDEGLGEATGADENENEHQGELDGDCDKCIDRSDIGRDIDRDGDGDSHSGRESCIDIDHDIDLGNEIGHTIEGDGGEIGSGEGAVERDPLSPNDTPSVSVGLGISAESEALDTPVSDTPCDDMPSTLATVKYFKVDLEETPPGFSPFVHTPNAGVMRNARLLSESWKMVAFMGEPARAIALRRASVEFLGGVAKLAPHEVSVGDLVGRGASGVWEMTMKSRALRKAVEEFTAGKGLVVKMGYKVGGSLRGCMGD